MFFWLDCPVPHSFIFLVSRSSKSVGEGKKLVHRNFLSYSLKLWKSDL
jgi:hypothetical protein